MMRICLLATIFTMTDTDSYRMMRGCRTKQNATEEREGATPSGSGMSVVELVPLHKTPASYGLRPSDSALQ